MHVDRVHEPGYSTRHQLAYDASGEPVEAKSLPALSLRSVLPALVFPADAGLASGKPP